MIERLTPEEYEQRQISDIPAQEEWLDKQLAEQKELQDYIYGREPEAPPPEEEKPVVQYVPAGVENSEKAIPWGLIGVIAVAGIIALSIVAVMAVKK